MELSGCPKRSQQVGHYLELQKRMCKPLVRTRVGYNEVRIGLQVPARVHNESHVL